MPVTPKRLGSVAYSLVMFVIVSVLAGVLIAGLFVPFAGLAGVSSRAAASELDNLPAELATPAPPTRTPSDRAAKSFHPVRSDLSGQCRGSFRGMES